MKTLIFLCVIGIINCFNIPDPLLSVTNLAATKFISGKLNSIDLDKKISRKILHITSAPSFIYTWQFYDSKIWASIVPATMLLLLITKNETLSRIISRSGDNNELGKGPALYTLILLLITLGYWKNDPIGMISMNQLAIGDGFAEIIGRKYGKTKWFGGNKSVEGTIAFFMTSSVFTYISLNIYNLSENGNSYNITDIILISFFCSMAELVSNVDDNITIPLTAILVNYFLVSNAA